MWTDQAKFVKIIDFSSDWARTSWLLVFTKEGQTIWANNMMVLRAVWDIDGHHAIRCLSQMKHMDLVPKCNKQNVFFSVTNNLRISCLGIVSCLGIMPARALHLLGYRWKFQDNFANMAMMAWPDSKISKCLAFCSMQGIECIISVILIDAGASYSAKSFLQNWQLHLPESEKSTLVKPMQVIKQSLQKAIPKANQMFWVQCSVHNQWPVDLGKTT